MTESTLSFDAVYDVPDTVREAGRAFRDYQFKRYGWLLASACVVNAAGLAFVHWAGAEHDALFYWVVFVVAIGPIFMLYHYFLGPSKFALKHRLVFSPAGSVTVGPQGVGLPTRGRAAVLPWSIIKIVLERQAFFILVLSPFSAYAIPRAGMPDAIYKALHARVAGQPAAQ